MDKQQVKLLFHPSLFWDVNTHSFDIDTHSRFIIERVSTRGDIADWKMLLELYGKKRIRDEIVTLRFLDPKSLNFLSVYFNIEKVRFKCCD